MLRKNYKEISGFGSVHGGIKGRLIHEIFIQFLDKFIVALLLVLGLLCAEKFRLQRKCHWAVDTEARKKCKKKE